MVCLFFLLFYITSGPKTVQRWRKPRSPKNSWHSPPNTVFLCSCPSEAVLVSNKLPLRRCNRKMKLDSSFHKHSSSNSPLKFLKRCLILSPYLPFFLFTASVRNMCCFLAKWLLCWDHWQTLAWLSQCLLGSAILWCSFAARKQIKVSYKQILSLLLCPLHKSIMLSGTYSSLLCPVDDLVCAGADGVPATSRLDKQAL